MDEKRTAVSLGIEAGLVAYLDGLSSQQRLEDIDNLIHRLQFERRFLMLTPEEKIHMEESLSPAARKRLEKAKTTEESEGLIEMYARALYFRRCAWADYLNGSGEKPFTPVGIQEAS